MLYLFTAVLREQFCILEEELCVQPMLWGLVPFWHRGSSPTDHKLTTNNARLEGLSDSKLYKPSVENDRRCVIVCDGFYEWKKLKSGQKQPYFVYANQMSNEDKFPDFAKANEKEHWSGEDWHGPRPLFMAGLYSIWYADNDEEAKEPSRKRSGIFNYTVITRYSKLSSKNLMNSIYVLALAVLLFMSFINLNPLFFLPLIPWDFSLWNCREANETLAWLHDRMPAILPDKESVTAWLDPHLHGTSALEVLPKTVSKGQVCILYVWLLLGQYSPNTAVNCI